VREGDRQAHVRLQTVLGKGIDMSITRRRVEAAGHVMSQVACRQQLTAQARNTLDQYNRRAAKRELDERVLRQNLKAWLDKWQPVTTAARS